MLTENLQQHNVLICVMGHECIIRIVFCSHFLMICMYTILDALVPCTYILYMYGCACREYAGLYMYVLAAMRRDVRA